MGGLAPPPELAMGTTALGALVVVGDLAAEVDAPRGLGKIGEAFGHTECFSRVMNPGECRRRAAPTRSLPPRMEDDVLGGAVLELRDLGLLHYSSPF